MSTPTYSMTASQRLRLIRSTHGLGLSLSETPSVETSPTFSPTHARTASTTSTESKRLGRIFTQADSGVLRSASLDESSSTEKKYSRPTALNLSVGKASSSAPPSPMSPTFSLALNSPLTPPPPPVAVTRRRKMDKLARTLGENVPPELVFPVNAPPRPPKGQTAHRHHHRRCASTLSDTRVAPAAAEEPFSFPSVIPVPAVDSDSDSNSDSEWELTDARSASAARADSTGMHRREQGWSGEWGGRVRDMEDVVRALRVLRLK